MNIFIHVNRLRSKHRSTGDRSENCAHICANGVCEKVANTVYGAAVRSIANYTGRTLVACAAAYREIEPRWRKDPQTTIKI